MPLPTWYRFIRASPGVVFGLAALAIGIYLIVAPVSYRDPSNPKMVAYANSMHPVVIAIGAVAALIGLGLTYFGASRYSRMPEALREYSYEQLRLGQALAREIARLTPDGSGLYSRIEGYEDGSKIYIDSWSYSRMKPWNRLWDWLIYGGGATVTYAESKPEMEVDGVLHIPELRLYIDTFTGKASRHESLEQYEVRETPPLLSEDSLLGEAIRSGELDEELEEKARWLVEPGTETVRLPHERPADWLEHHEFMRQMGLDKPSAEELRMALDKLKEW